MQNSSTTLADISELIVDSEHKTAPSQDTGYPNIRTPNIGRGRFILDDVRRVSEATYKEWTRRAIPQAGDLILAREAPVGNVAMIPNGSKFCLGQRTVLIRPDSSQVDPRYLQYLLLGDEMQHLMAGLSSGATVPHLNMSDIRGLPLPPLPSLTTQQKIAAVLSAYDDLIENNTRRIAILEEMAQAIYREWFVHFRFPGHEDVDFVETELGEVPAGWELKQLGDLAEQVRRTVDPQELDPDTPYIGLGHMPKKSIALSEWGRASEIKSTKLRFKQGEILFGKIRPYFHKVGPAPVNGIGSTDTIVIVPKDERYWSLVLGCVSSENFVAHATQSSKGTKMPRADWNVLVKYPVAIPTEPLLARFNLLIEDTVDLIHNMIFRNNNLRLTRDLLLPRLVSGQLDVSDMDKALEAGV